MTWIELFGWFAALTGIATSLPQPIKLLRDRVSAGLSVLMWQFLFAAGLSWLVHGIVTDRLNVSVPNGIAVVCNLATLILIQRDRKLGWLAVYPVAAVASAALIAIDLVWGPVAFGWAVVAPLLVGTLGQFRDLVVDEDVSGVSQPWLVASLIMQATWLLWSFPAGEVSVTICAGCLMVTATMNLVWLRLRRSGRVGAYGKHDHPVAELAEAVEV